MKYKKGKLYKDKDGKVLVCTNPKLDRDREAEFKCTEGCHQYYSASGWASAVNPREYRVPLAHWDGIDLKSLDFPAMVERGRLSCGCQHLSKNDTLKLFKWLGDQLGFDIEE